MTPRSLPRQSSTTPIIPVAIVGAGPTGLTAAALLGRYGIETLVLERWEDVYPQPRAVHVDGEVRRILAGIGLDEAFAAISWPALGARYVEPNMKVLAEFARRPLGRHGYPDANMFDQPEFETLLRANVAQNPNVTVKYNVEVTGLAAETNCVQVDYTDAITGATESLRARYVLGCDGANSMVRGSIEATMRDMKFEQRWLVVDVAVSRPVPLPEIGIGVCDPARAGIYIRIGKSRYRWEFRLRDGESAEDYRDDRSRLLALMAPWTRGVPVDALEFVRVADYIFRAQVADRWRKERVFILGDAAHLTPPFLGQGMCAGLRDAANLAWKLAGVLTGDMPERLLDTYEVERKPHAQAIIRRGKVIGMALTEGGELGNILRRLIMPHLHRVPGVAEMAADGETPPLHRSRMVVRRRRPLPDLAGRLVPNVLLDDDLRFDDVAGGRFAIIAVTEPSPEQRQEIERRGAVAVIASAASELRRWLRRGHTRAALVRPDGTVGRTGGDLTVLVEALPPFRSHRALPTRLTNTVTIPHSGPHPPSGSAS